MHPSTWPRRAMLKLLAGMGVGAVLARNLVTLAEEDPPVTDEMIRRAMTNLTGHPCVVLPNGFHADDGTPTSITFNGRLQGETELLAVAHAYQQATDFHLARPPLGSQPRPEREARS